MIWYFSREYRESHITLYICHIYVRSGLQKSSMLVDIGNFPRQLLRYTSLIFWLAEIICWRNARNKNALKITVHSVISPDNEFSLDKVTSFNTFTSTYRTAIMIVLSVFCLIFGIIHQQVQYCSTMSDETVAVQLDFLTGR